MNCYKCNKNTNLDQLSKLVDPSSPDEVRKAVFEILSLIGLGSEKTIVFGKIFSDIKDLYEGRYAGYKSCDTEYHDFRHTTDVLLATVRLVDALKLSGEDISDDGVLAVSIAALMHDAGYIPEVDDPIDNGAVYTANHVDRGIEFLKKYMEKNNYSRKIADRASQIILSTELKCDLKKVDFIDSETKRLALVLAAADLLGQMADRIYLEKLLFLYKEFTAGDISGFSSEEDLLLKTVEFYDLMKKRLKKDLEGVDQLMIFHFRIRHGIDLNLYHQGMENNIKYLHFILSHHSGSHRDFLRRDGLVSKL
jgi:hypothetical protein